jgi:transposase-like protein
MQCPEGKSTHIRKNGNRRGKQNHLCVDCGRQFIDHYTPRQGYSDALKRECLNEPLGTKAQISRDLTLG